MNDPTLTRIYEVFAAAVELPEDQRIPFVRVHCDREPEICQEVLTLLRRRSATNTLLDPIVNHGPARPPLLLLQADDVVGDFVVESFLARGGTSEVYRARQRSLGGRFVALKVMSYRGLSPTARARFAHEAHAAASIHHPHLVTVYGYGEDQERALLFYAMQLAEGPTLADVLEDLARSGPPDGVMQRTLVERVLEVSQALSSLHARSLVHRDVKPQNIVLLGPDGAHSKAMLVDLGLVRHVSTDTIASTQWATPAYAAPEQLLGAPIDARADVFSLGLTLHDMVAATRPAERGGIPAEGLVLLSKRIPDVDRDLEAIVARAIDPRPSERFCDAGAMARDLAHWLAGDAVSARQIRGVEKLRRFVMRHPGRVLRAALATFTAMTVLTILALGIQRLLLVMHARQEISSHWAMGNLTELRPALERFPVWFDAVLPDDLAVISQSIRRLEGDAPLIRVLRQIDVDAKAAPVLTAHLLARHGLVKQPMLGTFLLNAARSSPEESRLRQEAFHYLVRLMFEEPNQSAADMEASNAIRSWLRTLLVPETKVHDRLAALTALAGCGGAAEASLIMNWLRERVRLRESGCLEEVRLGLRCLDLITRRAHRCGYLGAVIQSSSGHAEMSCALEAIGAPSSGASLNVQKLLVEYYRSLLLVHRAAGVDPPDLTSVPDSVRRAPLVLAAAADPAFEQTLRDNPRVAVSSDHAGYDISAEYGRLVGSYGSAALESDLAPNALMLSKKPYAEFALGAFEKAVADAHRELIGLRPAMEPDRATCMAVTLDEDPGLEPCTLNRDRTDHADSVAWWCFDTRSVCANGSETVKVRAAPMRSDENEPHSWFLQLGAPGSSEVVLPFFLSPGESQHLHTLNLFTNMEKSTRALLPNEGEAWVEIWLDDTLVGSKIATMAGDNLTFDIVPRPEPDHREPALHFLKLKLASTSNTTVRVLQIGLAFEPLPGARPR